ncbi:MAG: LytTR family DNA-binding domain-containing protein [Pseudomonadota bacterium]
MQLPREVLTAWFRHLTDVKNLALCAIGALVAAYTGPFGTWMTMPEGERILFWAIVIVWSFVASTFTIALACARLSHIAIVPQKIISCLVFTAIFSPPLYLGLRAYVGVEEAGTFAWIAGISFVIALMISAIREILHISARSEVEAEFDSRSTAQADDGPRLLARLDGDPGPILRLSARDHFVNVVTATREHEIRMRLGDAVSEMEGTEGFFTHRSHWIARNAIERVLRDGPKTYVLSNDNQRVPVSRTHLPKLEDAGVV